MFCLVIKGAKPSGSFVQSHSDKLEILSNQIPPTQYLGLLGNWATWICKRCGWQLSIQLPEANQSQGQSQRGLELGFR